MQMQTRSDTGLHGPQKHQCDAGCAEQMLQIRTLQMPPRLAPQGKAEEDQGDEAGQSQHGVIQSHITDEWDAGQFKSHGNNLCDLPLGIAYCREEDNRAYRQSLIFIFMSKISIVWVVS